MDVSRPAGGLKWIWIGLVPTVIALAAALVWTIGVVGAVDSPAAAPAMTVPVTGHQWGWEVPYRGSRPTLTFADANAIQISAGLPVMLELKAAQISRAP